MRKIIIALLLFFDSGISAAVPLQDYQDFVTANPQSSKRGQWVQLLARGSGTDDMYVMEVDPVTGAIPVDAAFTFSADENYGVVGNNTLRTAAQIGNATGAGDFGTGAVSAQTLRTVSILSNGSANAAYGTGARGSSVLRVTLATDDVIAVTQSGSWSVGVSNLPTTADTNYGTPGSSTIRTAAMLGVGAAAVSNANPVPISDAGGSITVDGTVSVSNFPATQPVSGTVAVSSIAPVTTTTAAFQAEGALAFGSVTNAFQTIFTPSAATKILQMRNNTDASIAVSFDAGSTTNYVLDSGDTVSLDLESNALAMSTTAIQIKYAVGAPTVGSFRVNGAH